MGAYCYMDTVLEKPRLDRSKLSMGGFGMLDPMIGWEIDKNMVRPGNIEHKRDFIERD